LKNIKQLVLINPLDTADAIDKWLPKQEALVISQLDSEPEIQLKYLEQIIPEIKTKIEMFKKNPKTDFKI